MVVLSSREIAADYAERLRKYQAAVDSEQVQFRRIGNARLAAGISAVSYTHLDVYKRQDDHSKANDELKGLAARKNVTLPTSLDPQDQATMDRLSKLNGPAFDRAYMRDMVVDHKKDIADFRKEANSGADSDVKT